MEQYSFTTPSYDTEYYLKKARLERSKAATSLFTGLFSFVSSIFQDKGKTTYGSPAKC